LIQPGLYWCEVTVNGCSARDSVRITNLPGPPQNSIAGTAVVCPSVQGVIYSVEDIPKSTYVWQVAGGIITQQQGATITVDWGSANNQASVRVAVTDSLGCTGNPMIYPVRINTQLEPTLPDGPDIVCFNAGQGVVYTTTSTTGSVYNWSVEGGIITSGQGTSSVQVNWNEGANSIRVEERSATPETVCAGLSSVKDVVVFKDSARLSLEWISVDTVNEANIRALVAVGNPSRVLQQEVLLFKREELATIWRLHQVLPANTTEYVDGSNATSVNAYQYYVNLTNLCGEQLQSPPHQTVQLVGDADLSNNTITLQWGSYLGWEEGVLQYEVWRRLDQENGFRFIQALPPDQRTITLTTLSGFEHDYRIRAVRRNAVQGTESWSNSISFAFEHEVFVPNVITPNGDGFNQYFMIRNIELFPQSSLKIFNRWGGSVFEARGYNNTWRGDGLESGVYFYELALNRNNVVLKGTISIVR
jgi:gliding motility-associated-like protein